jgi:hypothetical protein
VTALRDASAATLLLLAAIWAGSGGFAHLDAALLGYLGATIVAVFGTAWRISTAWRRPAAAFYVRALWRACRDLRALRRTLAAAGRDVAAQRFIARRSRMRWVAHMLLSLGTLASFAITLPLVFGWMRFAADGQTAYRVLVVSLPMGRFVLDGAVAWLVFHGLVLAAVAVVVGALYFLVLRWRARRLPGMASAFHTGPLLLLLSVAVTGLALPATRGHPDVFPVVAVLHELTVVVLLVAMPFSKLGHLLIRPLQLGAQLVRATGEPSAACAGCGAAFAPSAQLASVEALLRARGLAFDAHQRHGPDCRRRRLAATQAGLMGAHFQPPLSGVFPRPIVKTERAA